MIKITKSLALFALVVLAVPAHAQMVEGAQDEDNVFQVEDVDAEMNAAIAEAQRALPEFLKHLGSGAPPADEVGFKFPLGGWEHIWVSNVRRDGDKLTGQFSNVPEQDGYKLGDTVSVPITDVSDWAYRPADGKMRGHYTTKVILKRLPPEQAAEINAYYGW